MHRKRRILHEEASSFFELLAETIALPVIPNTYPGANKAARPPSSTSLRVKLLRVERLRRAEQRLSQDRVPGSGRDEDRIARADPRFFAGDQPRCARLTQPPLQQWLNPRIISGL